MGCIVYPTLSAKPGCLLHLAEEALDVRMKAGVITVFFYDLIGTLETIEVWT